MGTARLYVGNLSLNTSEDSLRSAFERDGGSVLSVTIVKDEMTGRPRGFGFVQMGSTSDGLRVIADWNGRELDGHAILVSDAGERRARSEIVGSEFKKSTATRRRW